MKETIYTIPINQAYDVFDGCPICRLENELEIASIEYIMGPAMMEPDVRIETNKFGFCPAHFQKMLGINKRLSLSLMLESYLNELNDNILQEDVSKISKKEFEQIATALNTASDGCFVCNQLRDRMEKYYRNIIHLWRTDEEFRAKTRKQDYFCPHHLGELLCYARKDIDKKSTPLFLSDHISALKKKTVPLAENVSAFCKSFDHRYANVPLTDEQKHAVENAISFLNGNKNS